MSFYLILIRWYRPPSVIKNLGYPFLIHRCGTGLCYPVLQTDDFSGHLLFAFRRRALILLFASPVVGLWFIQAKFTGGCGHTRAFLTKFRRVLRAWLFGCWYRLYHLSHRWLRVYSLSRVSTSAGEDQTWKQRENSYVFTAKLTLHRCPATSTSIPPVVLSRVVFGSTVQVI